MQRNSSESSISKVAPPKSKHWAPMLGEVGFAILVLAGIGFWATRDAAPKPTAPANKTILDVNAFRRAVAQLGGKREARALKLLSTFINEGQEPLRSRAAIHFLKALPEKGNAFGLLSLKADSMQVNERSYYTYLLATTKNTANRASFQKMLVQMASDNTARRALRRFAGIEAIEALSLRLFNRWLTEHRGGQPDPEVREAAVVFAIDVADFGTPAQRAKAAARWVRIALDDGSFHFDRLRYNRAIAIIEKHDQIRYRELRDKGLEAANRRAGAKVKSILEQESP